MAASSAHATAVLMAGAAGKQELVQDAYEQGHQPTGGFGCRTLIDRSHVLCVLSIVGCPACCMKQPQHAVLEGLPFG